MSDNEPKGRLSWNHLKESHRKSHKRKTLPHQQVQKIQVLDLSFGEAQKSRSLSRNKFTDPLQQLNEWLRSHDNKVASKDQDEEKEDKKEPACFKQTSISRFFSRKSSAELEGSPQAEAARRGGYGEGGWSRSHSYLMIKRMNRRKEKMALNRREEMEMEFHGRKEVPIHNTQHHFYKSNRIKTESYGPPMHFVSPMPLSMVQPIPATLKVTPYASQEKVYSPKASPQRARKQWAIKVLKQRRERIDEKGKESGKSKTQPTENGDVGISPWVRSSTRNQDFDIFN